MIYDLMTGRNVSGGKREMQLSRVLCKGERLEQIHKTISQTALDAARVAEKCIKENDLSTAWEIKTYIDMLMRNRSELETQIEKHNIYLQDLLKTAERKK